MAVRINNAVFLDMTPCSLTKLIDVSEETIASLFKVERKKQVHPKRC